MLLVESKNSVPWIFKRSHASEDRHFITKSLPEAPDKYTLPEIPEQYDTETPLMDGWKKYCHENKLGQEAFNKGIDG